MWAKGRQWRSLNFNLSCISAQTAGIPLPQGKLVIIAELRPSANNAPEGLLVCTYDIYVCTYVSICLCICICVCCIDMYNTYDYFVSYSCARQELKSPTGMVWLPEVRLNWGLWKMAVRPTPGAENTWIAPDLGFTVIFHNPHHSFTSGIKTRTVLKHGLASITIKCCWPTPYWGTNYI